MGHSIEIVRGVGEAQELCNVGDALIPDIEPPMHDVDRLGIFQIKEASFIVLEDTGRGLEAHQPPSMLTDIYGLDLLGDKHSFVPLPLQVYDHTPPCIHISE